MTLKRLPFFELTIVVVMVILGWAAFWLYNEETAVKVQTDDAKELKKKADKASKESEAMQKVYQELQRAFQGALSPAQADIMENMLKLSETLRIQEEYFSIADHLTSSLSNLHNVLIDGVSRRSSTLAERFHRQSSEFEAWLKKEKDHVEVGRFRARTQRLMERIEKERLTSTNGSLAITMDLETLVYEIGRAYASYLAAAELVLNNTGAKWQFAPSRLEQAGIRTKELFGLAERARADGEAAKSFLASQSQSESIKRLVSQQRALTLLSNSQSAVDFISQAGISSQAVGPGDSNSEVTDPSLRRVLYGLLIALGGLGVFLMVAIYRRMVVAPLRLKLLASASENKLVHFENLLARQGHELKQPLTAINAWVWTLQKSLAENSPEHQVATAIRKEIVRLDRLVRNLLKPAQPLEPKLIPMKAEPVLREILDLFRAQLERQSIHLQVESAVDSFFRADPQQLKQVLINLVQNAAESIEQGGTITLRARRDKAPLKGRPSEVVIIEVADNGPGIQPEVQERLFDPFFSTKKEGTGLGLTIVKKIIDRHEGELTLRTHPGQGTTFGIVLPIYHGGG